MSTVFFIPHSHLNDYVDINKEAISDAGYSIEKINLKTILRALFTKSAIVVNWLEDRPYASNLSSLGSFIATIKCLLLLILGAIMCSNKVWVSHNFKPHNSKKRFVYFKIITKSMSLLGYEKLSLEEYAGGGLFHPLYLKDDEVARQQPKKQSRFSYLIFGAVKKYKGLDKILEIWPSYRPLKIVGKCSDPEYKRELLEIVKKRNISVTWIDEYVDTSELNKHISEAHFVVMSHLDDTMISSGTFYHAVTYGCNIVAMPSKFSRHKQIQHKFVHLIDKNRFDVDAIERGYVQANDVKNIALSYHSRGKLTETWKSVLSQ